MEDAKFILEQADRVVVVPGYGMAVAQAQHAVRELSDELENTEQKLSLRFTRSRDACPGI